MIQVQVLNVKFFTTSFQVFQKLTIDVQYNYISEKPFSVTLNYDIIQNKQKSFDKKNDSEHLPRHLPEYKYLAKQYFRCLVKNLCLVNKRDLMTMPKPWWSLIFKRLVVFIKHRF